MTVKGPISVKKSEADFPANGYEPLFGEVCIKSGVLPRNSCMIGVLTPWESKDKINTRFAEAFNHLPTGERSILKSPLLT